MTAVRSIDKVRRVEKPRPMPWYQKRGEKSHRVRLAQALRHHGWTISAIARALGTTEQNIELHYVSGSRDAGDAVSAGASGRKLPIGPLLLALAVGCDSGTVAVQPDPPRPATVAVGPLTATLSAVEVQPDPRPTRPGSSQLPTNPNTCRQGVVVQAAWDVGQGLPARIRGVQSGSVETLGMNGYSTNSRGVKEGDR